MLNKNRTTQLSLLTALSLGLAQSATAGDGWNSASDSLVSQSQLEAEMDACGFMDDLDKMYTRCLQVNHPRHHGNNHARWGARGTICTELVNDYDAPVWYRQDVANETDAALKGNDCIAEGALADALASTYVGPGCSEAFPHGFPSSEDMGLCFSDEGLEVVESYINYHADWTSAAEIVNDFSYNQWIFFDQTRWEVEGAVGKYGLGTTYGHKRYVTDLELTTGQCSAGFSRVATRDTALNMIREVTGMYWLGTPLNGDLNQDAGGKDIFLCEKIEWAPASAAVTNILITNDTSKSDCSAFDMQAVHRRNGLNGDTNQSTGGGSRDVFLCLDKDLTDGAPLERVTLLDSSGTCDYAAGEMPAKKSYGSRGDLNAGTGSSKDIFICGDHDEDWQSVIGADTTPSWPGSITQMMLQDTKTCPTGFISAKTHDGLNGDLNEGAVGGSIYVCYSTQQWRGDPITNFYVDTKKFKDYSGDSYTDDFREVHTVNLDGNLNQGADRNGFAKTPSGLYLYYNRFNGDFRYYRTRWFSEFSLMSVRPDGFGTRCDNKPGTRNNWKANDDGIHNNVYKSHEGLQTAGLSQIDLNYDVSGSKDVFPCGIYHDVN